MEIPTVRLTGGSSKVFEKALEVRDIHTTNLKGQGKKENIAKSRRSGTWPRGRRGGRERRKKGQKRKERRQEGGVTRRGMIGQPQKGRVEAKATGEDRKRKGQGEAVGAQRGQKRRRRNSELGNGRGRDGDSDYG